ncbi:Nucleotidyltransferase domain-containing protein [Friedmanniella luteola]|uniref:Nucleotidyltransferase domain-containing protein n=1 Tax=Friedmanniella luteola TaxID=546871 RepID=A0A1H1VCB2_9ACTN|nr:nucleotidyltransferase domain-containing protein [Friedmanniella luteola]SDS82323.1 Nucleotidyltransferase domain-containing protein [Friedmanniella luteola]
MLSDVRLHELAAALVGVGGVEAVTLGGSRARGTQRPDSDVDLGLYYRPPLDVAGLRALAATLARARDGQVPQVTEPGAWGRWVDGGGWLLVDGMAVDWIYRDLDRVRASCAAAQQGSAEFHAQVGHPLGVPDFAYAGEVALGRVLADPAGELAVLRTEVATYPPALARALVGRLAEAAFLLGGLDKPAGRGDAAFVAGALFRVVGLCAHALHARAGRWVITEKGLVDATGTLAGAPTDFSRRAHTLLGGLGTTPDGLRASVAAAAALLAEVVDACADPPAR